MLILAHPSIKQETTNVEDKIIVVLNSVFRDGLLSLLSTVIPTETEHRFCLSYIILYNYTTICETMNVCFIVACSKRNIFIGPIVNSCLGKLSLVKSKHARKNVHASRLNANGSKNINKLSASNETLLFCNVLSWTNILQFIFTICP